jgi:hypothetical protein
MSPRALGPRTVGLEPWVAGSNRRCRWFVVAARERRRRARAPCITRTKDVPSTPAGETVSSLIRGERRPRGLRRGAWRLGCRTLPTRQATQVGSLKSGRVCTVRRSLRSVISAMIRAVFPEQSIKIDRTTGSRAGGRSPRAPRPAQIREVEGLPPHKHHEIQLDVRRCGIGCNRVHSARGHPLPGWPLRFSPGASLFSPFGAARRLRDAHGYSRIARMIRPDVIVQRRGARAAAEDVPDDTSAGACRRRALAVGFGAHRAEQRAAAWARR